MDTRRIWLAIASLISLSACGPQKMSSTSFRTASDECQSRVIPKQFVARFHDGRTVRVKAESKEAFIAGYLTEHFNEIAFAEHDFYVQLDAQSPSAQDVGFADNWGAINTNV